MMMDGFNLFFQFLWLLGLALLLAASSLVHWQAEQAQKSLAQGLAEPASRLALAAAFFLFALGLAGVMEPWAYKAGWGGLLLLAAWTGLAAWGDRTNHIRGR